jgi:hypothetical protein
MNYFKLLVALLASASSVSASAHAKAGADEASAVDYETVFRLIRDGDHPNEVDAAFHGCWTYIRDFGLIFLQMVEYGRLGTFEVCLPQLNFRDEDQRDHVFSALLRVALRQGNREIVEFLLSQRFTLDEDSNWGRLRWSLEEMKQLIAGHPEHIVGLAPSPGDFSHLKNVGDGMILIGLTRHYQETRPGTVDVTDLLRGLLHSDLSDADATSIAQQLLDMGALVDRLLLDRMNGVDGNNLIKELLCRYLDYQSNDVKEPEED